MYYWVFVVVDVVDDMRDGINFEDFMADMFEVGCFVVVKGVKVWLKVYFIVCWLFVLVLL